MNFKQKIIVFAAAVMTAVLFSACGPKPIGWGVMYIDDSEHSLSAGTVIPVYQESEIRNVYGLMNANEQPFEIDRWTMSFHSKETEAEAFSKSYADWANFYATNLLNGLSIREEASIGSKRVYKLREGQTVKIIGRDENKQNIANHDGYWYLVLTDDGISGYCFDKNLRIFDKMNQNSQEDKSLDQESLDIFLTKPFRPEYYRTMVRRNQIELNRFREDYGIFAYPEEKKIVLRTEERYVEFNYTEIVQNARGRFIFEGSVFQLEIRSDEKIAIFYPYNNREYAETMVFIPEIEEVIAGEVERRDMLLQKVAELGAVSSTAYGRISFEEDGKFSWSRNSRLVPNVIPESATGTGTVSINYLEGMSLRDDYDGVLSFAFDGVPGRSLVNFLFKLSDMGIKLVYVPAGDIDDNFVEKVNTSPLVLFMSAAGE